MTVRVTENMGIAAAKKQFIIGGEGSSGQSITMLVRLALFDQTALMRQYNSRCAIVEELWEIQSISIPSMTSK